MSDPGVVWRGEQPEPGLGAGQPQPPQRRQQPRQREQARPVARPGTQHRAQQGAVTGGGGHTFTRGYKDQFK